jgi:hypothetical protein
MDDSRTPKRPEQKVGVYDSRKGFGGLSPAVIAAIVVAILIILLLWWLLA